MGIRHDGGVRTVLVVLGLGLGTLGLAGCDPGDKVPAALVRKPAARKAPAPGDFAVDPAVAEVTRTMASGVPLGKSTAPLEVRFNLGAVPSPGVTFVVDVAVLPEAPAPVLHVEVTGGDGLTIQEPDGFFTFEKVQAGSVTHLKIRANSAAAGTRLVQIRATLELPEGPESKVFAFPVVIGGPAPAAPAGPAPAPKAPAKDPKN